MTGGAGCDRDDASDRMPPEYLAAILVSSAFSLFVLACVLAWFVLVHFFG